MADRVRDWQPEVVVGMPTLGMVYAVKETNAWVQKLADTDPKWPQLVRVPIRCPLFAKTEGAGFLWPIRWLLNRIQTLHHDRFNSSTRLALAAQALVVSALVYCADGHRHASGSLAPDPSAVAGNAGISIRDGLVVFVPLPGAKAVS